jgi:serine/threonine protein phosphatase PrpC/predicted Ser/Thr protein kinase
MTGQLAISIGQHSDKGRKESNQDFHGALIPEEPLLGTKGIAIALADGISTSRVGHVASESAIKSFLTDYYCTSESWSVKTSAQRVIAATNSWLHAQTRGSCYAYEDKDRGYVCTLSAVILKSATAHIFHVGDSRVYRVSRKTLELLTEDHRVTISAEQNYLSRALGINPQVEIDYHTVQLEKGDVFILATDGVYEHLSVRYIASAVQTGVADLDATARMLIEKAYKQGSADNLTIQIVRIDELPEREAGELAARTTELPLPPLLETRMTFDGYRIVRELHDSSRSHIYLAVDTENEELVALKIPSIDLRGDPAYRKRFMMEEWVARRIDSPHVLKPCAQSRRRNTHNVVREFVEGQTLTQWMIDNPKPGLETVRGIVEQIAMGLRAFHRMEMLHQDLRPENIMIDKTGTVKIIDFGSVKVAGIAENELETDGDQILGTVQYTAPEYFLGEPATPRSDLFSLAVITYQMLSGKLPYGAQAARARTKSQFRKLNYRPLANDERNIPAWINGVLRKALNPDPYKRHEALSEFVFDLRNPDPKYMETPVPLIERNPLLFWKSVSFALGLAVLLLLITRFAIR